MPERPAVSLRTRRLVPGDTEMARRLFSLMAEVFEVPNEPLGDDYLERLLNRPEFWAMGALVGDQLVGGVTAHVIPMTRSESSELFIYDVAVRADMQRQGIGRALMRDLCAATSAQGIGEAFVPADNEDTHALDFYRGLGGVAMAVTIFTFGGDSE